MIPASLRFFRHCDYNQFFLGGDIAFSLQDLYSCSVPARSFCHAYRFFFRHVVCSRYPVLPLSMFLCTIYLFIFVLFPWITSSPVIYIPCFSLFLRTSSSPASILHYFAFPLCLVFPFSLLSVHYFVFPWLPLYFPRKAIYSTQQRFCFLCSMFPLFLWRRLLNL